MGYAINVEEREYGHVGVEPRKASRTRIKSKGKPESRNRDGEK